MNTTYKAISTVTVVLKSGETAVHEHAGFSYGTDQTDVWSLADGAAIVRYQNDQFQKITHTVERREVKKRIRYVVRYANGVETEYASLAGAYCAAHDDDEAYEHFHSIRREEREELA